ncbi:MAG TPA: hypothetical protein VMG12_27045 [Polyangiaceae bacterium]|nr:hypothetical protein [Polyangiaceae bacterium]
MSFFCPLSGHSGSVARLVRRAALAGALLFSGAGCLSQSYEVSAPELARLVELPVAERGEHVRVTQQTSFGNDLRDVSVPYADVDVALLVANYDDPAYGSKERRSRRYTEHDADDDTDAEGAAEEALAAAVVVVATAATAAVTLGVTEGARFDGWVRAPEQHPVLLVDRYGRHRWERLASLDTGDLHDVDHAVLADFSDDLEPLERHPLDRSGFVYQLEFGAEPAPFEGPSLAVSGRGGVGYMPSQHYGFLLGAAFSTARDDQAVPVTADAATLSFDYRVFLQAEAWPLHAGRWHSGPYAELGYGWALADYAYGSRDASGPVAALGGALQLDWTTRLALTLRAGVAALPEADSRGSPLTSGGYRLAPALTLGVSIY